MSFEYDMYLMEHKSAVVEWILGKMREKLLSEGIEDRIAE